jgi:ABC-type sugar transport system permease subunit
VSTAQTTNSLAPPRTPAEPKRGTPRRRPRRLGTALALAPAGLLILAFAGYPLIESGYLSLTRWGGIGSPTWTGFSNYSGLFTDGTVAHAALVTVEFAVLATVGIVVLATALAATVSAGVKGRAFYRVIWFLPGIAPVTAVGIFWSQAAVPQQGAVNVVLGWLGLGDEHEWLAQSSTAIYPTAAAAVWAGVGFAFILILGATEQIDVSIYEAAKIDGASRLRQFFAITLPLIRPVLAITTMLEFVWAANGFTMVWAMTGGGPGTATQTLPVLIYVKAFQFTDFGSASAMAVLSGAVLLVLGLIGLRLSNGRETSR